MNKKKIVPIVSTATIVIGATTAIVLAKKGKISLPIKNK